MELIKPSLMYKEQFLELEQDWKTNNEKMIPFHWLDTSNFYEFVHKTNECSVICPDNFVNHSTFWLKDDKNNLVGVVNIRHELNENLKVIGGHIGYGIRPSFRGKGFGNTILKLSLIEATKLGIKKALITCDKANLSSIKVIENNGGNSKEEDIYEGIPIFRFQINLND